MRKPYPTHLSDAEWNYATRVAPYRLQALNGEGQQEADDLQFETSGPHRVDLPGEQRPQVTENRLDVLANGLAQELLPRRHGSLGSLLALGLDVQANLF